MKNEKYDFTIDNNGQQYQNSSTYKNSSTNLLAVANFSVGYNRALRQNITLRIEPYIKIPLKGVGIGSLPIMSTGLNIGITKKISGNKQLSFSFHLLFFRLNNCRQPFAFSQRIK